MANKEDQKALTKRSEDQAKWYTEVVQRAGMADYSPVRGCMVIKPYGYAVWEKIVEGLGGMIKEAGIPNAYFPLFIPYSYLLKEAEHVEGFAPEVALVTEAGGKKLEEPLAIRPTSETIMYEMFSKWIKSYRDLPFQVNQWANVVRWEKRTSPFLRTTEFLWQEGHTAHATKEEAETEVMRALDMYEKFVNEWLAMSVIKGKKTEAEKFAGADYTVSIEALMKDGKVLQGGTSHMLGQNFAKPFNVKFVDEEGEEKYVWQTSWGTSTRLIGGLIMQHGDDKGLVLPPVVAPIQVIVIPIFKAENKDEVLDFVKKVEAELKEIGIRYEVDLSDNRPGFKFAEAEMKGIPLRFEVGPKDVKAESVMVVERLTGSKNSLKLSEIGSEAQATLDHLQKEMLKSAEKLIENSTRQVKTYEEFKKLVDEGFIGLIDTFFDGNEENENMIKEETKYKSVNVPFKTMDELGPDLITGREGKRTFFARNY